MQVTWVPVAECLEAQWGRVLVWEVGRLRAWGHRRLECRQAGHLREWEVAGVFWAWAFPEGGGGVGEGVDLGQAATEEAVGEWPSTREHFSNNLRAAHNSSRCLQCLLKHLNPVPGERVPRPADLLIYVPKHPNTYL